MDRFADRRLIVTGAGSGIGRRTVARLLDEGATVVAYDVSATAWSTPRQPPTRPAPASG